MAPAQVTDAMLKRAARAAFLAAPVLPHGTYQVTIVLTDDAEMRNLNRTWRGKDAATNVLSFPADDGIREPGLLGDVVLAYETTLEEARQQNIALQDHVSHLVVHGVLHLLGFDHAEDEAAERMESLERTALASLGIADPYAEDADACGGVIVSNTPIAENDVPAEEARQTDEEVSWFERLLATFGLGEEPDLRELIEDALARSKSDTLSAQERSMLRRILRFGKLTVEDVMVPRADIIAVDDNVTIDELMRVFRQAEHSRLPVYHETLDDPRGMIHIRDLMSWITTQAETGGAGRTRSRQGRPQAHRRHHRTSRGSSSTCRARCRCSISCSRCRRRGCISRSWSTNMAAPTGSSPSRIWSKRWSARSPTSTTSRTSR